MSEAIHSTGLVGPRQKAGTASRGQARLQQASADRLELGLAAAAWPAAWPRGQGQRGHSALSPRAGPSRPAPKGVIWPRGHAVSRARRPSTRSAGTRREGCVASQPAWPALSIQLRAEGGVSACRLCLRGGTEGYLLPRPRCPFEAARSNLHPDSVGPRQARQASAHALLAVLALPPLPGREESKVGGYCRLLPATAGYCPVRVIGVAVDATGRSRELGGHEAPKGTPPSRATSPRARAA